MFELDLLEYFEIGHIMKRDCNISLTEYNAMLPWHREVYIQLIKRDQQADATRQRGGR